MPLFNRLLRRAFDLMRARPLAHKVGALIAALIIPLLVLLTLQWREQQRLIDYSRQELRGLDIVQQVMPLAVQVEHLRAAIAATRPGGDTAGVGAAPDADAHLTALRGGVTALQQAVAEGQFTDFTRELETSLEPVVRLTQDPQARDRRLFEAAHSRAASSLKEFNLRVAERSGLLFDPDARSYFLMDLVVERLLSLSEVMGRSRAAAVSVLARGDANAADRERVIALTLQTRERLQHVRGRLEALTRSGGQLPGEWSDSYRQIDDALQFSRASFEAEAIQADPREVSEVGGRALTAVELLQNELLRELRALLEQRIAEARQAQWLVALMVSIALAAAGFIAWVFFKSFVGSTLALVKNLEQASRGNLSFPVVIRGQDEIAHMGNLVEVLCRSTSAMVSDIRTSATRLGEAGQTVASEGVALAHRTDAQAHSLRQSVEVMEHLVGQVATTADGVSQISELTQNLHSQAQAGNTAMMTAVQSMDCLQASAKRVAEINGVIDDIAFQTNLVALNASVEAAKAGESGRGFSVVAAEIRQLAQRCVAAAAEVRELIDTTNYQVESTSLQIQSVGSALIGLQTGVSQVLERLHSVANASAEQSAGLEQVSAEILSLQGLTQEGAAAVERCEVAAATLLGQASSLSRSVKMVKLREGSADEAKAMTLQARELVAAVGWENAAEEFNEEHGAWHDRGMYIFAWDDEGVCLAYGVKPQWVGRNIYEFPNGSVDMVEDFLQKAFAVLNLPEREGWVDYQQLDAHTMQPVSKSAYIVGLAGGGFMGCSVLRNAMNDVGDGMGSGQAASMTSSGAEGMVADAEFAEKMGTAPMTGEHAEHRAAETA